MVDSHKVEPGFDPSKRFIHMEDNEDGTMTFTCRFGEYLGGLEVEDQTLSFVMAISFDDYMLGLMEGMTFEAVEELMQIVTVIPDSPEETDERR